MILKAKLKENPLIGLPLFKNIEIIIKNISNLD